MSMFRNLILNEGEDLSWIDDAATSYSVDKYILTSSYKEWPQIKLSFVPDDSGAINWLYNNDAYLDTGVTISATNTYEVKFKGYDTSVYNTGSVFGGTSWLHSLATSANVMAFYATNKTFKFDVSKDKTYVVKANNTSVYVNGSSISSYSDTNTDTTTIRIFSGRRSVKTFYMAYFFINTRRYFPFCRDGVNGMLDLTTNTFLGNSNMTINNS